MKLSRNGSGVMRIAASFLIFGCAAVAYAAGGPEPVVLKQEIRNAAPGLQIRPGLTHTVKTVPGKYRHLFGEISDIKNIPVIHIKEARILFESGQAVFIDARSRQEYNAAHIPGSEYIGVADARHRIPYLREKLEGKVLVPYCYGTACRLSDKVAQSLFDAGYRRLVLFNGGWPEWMQALMPVAKYSMPEAYKFLDEPASSKSSIRKVSIDQARYIFDNALAHFMDADAESKFSELRVQNAYSIPPERFDEKMRAYNGILLNNPVVIYGRGLFGMRASEAARRLQNAGYKRVFVLKGTLSDWEKAGHPVFKKGK